MKEIDLSKKYTLEPMIEVMPYSKIKERDVIVLRCEKGEENAAISKINSALRVLIDEKDLRILALTPDYDTESLSIAVQTANNWEQDNNG
jgi:hypothetical protein